MTEQPTNQEQLSNKETNFRLQERALQEKYERQLAQERAEKEKLLKELEERKRTPEPEEDDDEPYVNKKKLGKELARFGENTRKMTQDEINRQVQQALEQERMNAWLEKNRDFEEVLNKADKLYEKDPEYAQTILNMPDSFERQKLVYKAIKNMGLDKPPEPLKTVQDRINERKSGGYYQPTGMSFGTSAPHSSDFSPDGQKKAYEKMQELKSRLRI